jgi:hypothetical protein
MHNLKNPEPFAPNFKNSETLFVFIFVN